MTEPSAQPQQYGRHPVIGKKKLAFIGTGSMGRPMIDKLLRNGYSVRVNDKYRRTADEPVAITHVFAENVLPFNRMLCSSVKAGWPYSTLAPRLQNLSSESCF